MPLLTFRRNGDSGQMHRPMLACHDSLFRYARALTRDQADAEELVQECFQRALRAKRKPAATEPEEIRRWMFVILRNVWKNSARARKREVVLEAAGPLESGSASSPEARLLRRALQVEVRAALDSLSDPHREVIVLRDVEGMTYEEIAQTLERPVGTVMSRIARARTQLREVLSEVVGSEPRQKTGRETHR